ncbi:MAG TPA: PQQ-binding-like beta-propeller repeat protein [Ktedonobacterales bacterium]|nr:PQQ-binding-like beta-propeller repeat protein [Ktedonobacterales bacterium]
MPHRARDLAEPHPNGMGACAGEALITRDASTSWMLITTLAIAILFGALSLAGCDTRSGSPSRRATPAATGEHVYYTYPTGITLPSGASKPTGGEVAALDTGTGAMAWRRPTGTPLFKPNEINHVVYVSSYSDDPRASTLDALDPRAGKAIWSHTTQGTFANPPVVVDGTIYVSASQQDSTGGFTGIVQALGERDGALRWQISTAGTPSPAAVDGKTVYVAAMGSPLSDSSLLALDAGTGHVRWRYVSTAQLSTLDPRRGPSDALLPPAPIAGLVITISTIRDSHGFAIQSVLALDAGSGKPRWQYSTGGIVGAPVIAHGALYISADIVEGNGSYSTLVALRITDGALLWRRDAGSDHAAQVLVTDMAFAEGAEGQGSPSEPRLLVIESHVTQGTTTAAMVGLSPSDGHARWTISIGRGSIGAPLLTGDFALIQALDQSAPNRGTVRMLAIQPSDGTVRWRQDIGDWPTFNDATPWVVGGSIYDTVTSYSGNTPRVFLIALRISDGARQWQWHVGSP